MLGGMNNVSISLSSLTEDKYHHMRACLELQERTSERRVFALTTAIGLLAVEQPLLPRDTLKISRLYVIARHHNARYHMRDASFVTWPYPLDTVTIDRKLTCTSPACTWAMMSSVLSLEELIVLGDSMMRRDGRLRRATPSDFVTYLDSVTSWAKLKEHRNRRMFRGIQACRQALRLMREGSDSSQEVRSSLSLMRYGLDHPVFNYPVHVPESNRCLYLDMAYPEFALAIEYEGSHHAQQWLSDVTRQQVIEDAGWSYMQITKLNLGNETEETKLAQRVARRVEQRIGRPVPLLPRQSTERLCDGRRWRIRPLWQRLGVEPVFPLVPNK